MKGWELGTWGAGLELQPQVAALGAEARHTQRSRTSAVLLAQPEVGGLGRQRGCGLGGDICPVANPPHPLSLWLSLHLPLAQKFPAKPNLPLAHTPLPPSPGKEM